MQIPREAGDSPRPMRGGDRLSRRDDGRHPSWQWGRGRFVRRLRPRGIRAAWEEGNNPDTTMLHWTLVFLVIAVIAAILGFGTLAGAAATIAKICFVLFLVIWLVTLLTARRA